MCENSIKHEFLMCEDGSTDGSKELILELEKNYPIVNLSTIERRGYGGGVIAGLKNANYDYILCIDSDGQCMPDSFLNIYRLVDSCDIAIGIRAPRTDPFIRKIYSGLIFCALPSIIPKQN
jgi:glycosyltransferase involved in cell wall biosynthesis